MVCLAWGKGKGEGEGEGEGERESAMAPPLLPSGLRAADVVRLMAQCIHEMGYTEVAQSLEEHAGVKALAEPVAAFRHAILNGDWPSVEAHIDQLQLTERSSRSVRFLILRQKFYELLESRGAAEAMVCLREEIAPLEVTEGARLAHDVDNCSSIQPTNGIHHQPSTQHSRTVELGSARLGRNLHELSRCLMCRGLEELHAQTGWDGATGSSRCRLLEELQAFVPPTLLLPERRLDTLLQQAVQWQTRHSSIPHKPSEEGLLFQDIRMRQNIVPNRPLQKLDRHQDEVWFVEFSHDGSMLASASRDGIIILWSVPSVPHSHEAHITQKAVCKAIAVAHGMASWDTAP
mmetsp:Transcript_9667/g.29439  ORF Transcript_9667/g.29439 Transcript_9667/m.29439 type:complete len:347 (-) Transcript_9667:1846-2886(-)